ncbi:DUF6612 family protein [Halobacillus sp. BBL2006]|uniref:DUF6612 family protein n=1 Tax=Halobacillus sp. BBL2006 TaxID=1543706 RepID=UPI00350F5C35
MLTRTSCHEGDGEKLLKMSMEMMKQNVKTEGNSDLDSFMQKMLENVTINNLSYELTIDKENHYLTGMMMDLDMSVKA